MKFIDLLRKFLLTISMLIYGVLVCLVIVQVFNRYVLGHALMWGDELAKLLLVWGIMLAVPLCIYYKRHMAVDNILVKFPPKGQKILWTFINILIVIMGVFYVFQGFELVFNNKVQVMATLHISKAYSYAALPVCAIFWTIFALADIYMVWKEIPHKPLIIYEDNEDDKEESLAGGGDVKC